MEGKGTLDAASGWVTGLIETGTEVGLHFGLKILGALAIWIIGRWLIKLTTNMIGKSLSARQIDETVSTYARSVVGVLFNIALVVAVLGFFGVETTTFAALIAAAGVAIGMAWSGLLANFAAGAFLLVLRPFRVGDFIQAGGVIGTVEEIGLFVTTIQTMDNVKTFVGNNKIFGDNIQNFTANPFRRVDLKAQLNHQVEPQKAVQLLKAKLATIPNVLGDPAPDVEILEFNLAGPVLAVRPYCHNDNYWQVYFDTNAAIRAEFGKAGFDAPQQHFQVQQSA